MLSCLSLLLAVTTLAQGQAGPRRARTPRPSRPVIADALTAPIGASLDEAAQALIAAQSNMDALAVPMAALEATVPLADLQALTVSVPMLAVPAADLQAAAWALAAPDVDDADEPVWPDQNPQQKDAGDSLYRQARQALNDEQFDSAAVLFRSLRDRYPRSSYVANSYYWQAYALYRDGSDESLRSARDALHMQSLKYPKASTRRDAEVLMRRVKTALARSGDAQAAADLTAEAESLAPLATPAIAAVPPVAAAPAIAPAPPGARYRRRDRDESCDDDDDIRIAALNGLLQMDAERAVPILKGVLARRDTGSTCLRRKAVFLVSQKRSSETSAILLSTVRSDPDLEVREQAVFWLSQVPGEETVAALDSILRDPKTDPDIQDKAIFALSQHSSPRSGEILRAYAERRDAPEDTREKAIFWLGQRHAEENAQFLRDLYAKLDNDDLKQKVLFSVSQMGGTDNYHFLMDIALNQKEDIDLRKKALFWAGQSHTVDITDLVKLYDRVVDQEMKEQLIFVYSQRREDAALDKLFAIGKTDPDRELRKKAIFWIGQSRSPRAAQYLQELINQ